MALKITAASKNRAIKESAALSAQVVLQNQGIEQMRVAGEAAERRAITATQKAAAAKREYDRRIREIMAAPVPADCAGAIKWGANQAEKLGEEWR